MLEACMSPWNYATAHFLAVIGPVLSEQQDVLVDQWRATFNSIPTARVHGCAQLHSHRAQTTTIRSVWHCNSTQRKKTYMWHLKSRDISICKHGCLKQNCTGLGRRHHLHQDVYELSPPKCSKPLQARNVTRRCSSIDLVSVKNNEYRQTPCGGDQECQLAPM